MTGGSSLTPFLQFTQIGSQDVQIRLPEAIDDSSSCESRFTVMRLCASLVLDCLAGTRNSLRDPFATQPSWSLSAVHAPLAGDDAGRLFVPA